MNNVIRFNHPGNRQAIREQACLWVMKLDGGISDSELRELHAWLDENPAHVKALLDVASMWDQVSVLSELSDIFPLREYLSPRPLRRRRLLACAALAAFALALCLHNPLLAWLDSSWSGTPAMSMPLSYETRIGEQSTIRLSDGSEVILNTNSRIDVNFSPASRDIILYRGEGFFSVAKDSTRPFRVHVDGGVIEAIGTAFTVQHTLLESLEVTVLEGVVNFTRTPPTPVAVQPPGPAVTVSSPEPAPDAMPAPQAGGALAAADSISLSAGESVQLKEEDDTIEKQKIQPNELESRVAWRHGMLLFQGDPLEKVIQEVSRYTSIRIDVDEAVRQIQVMGYFRTGDIEGILLTMRDTFNINVERLSDEHIVLKSNNQE